MQPRFRCQGVHCPINRKQWEWPKCPIMTKPEQIILAVYQQILSRDHKDCLPQLQTLQESCTYFYFFCLLFLYIPNLFLDYFDFFGKDSIFRFTELKRTKKVKEEIFSSSQWDTPQYSHERSKCFWFLECIFLELFQVQRNMQQTMCSFPTYCILEIVSYCSNKVLPSSFFFFFNGCFVARMTSSQVIDVQGVFSLWQLNCAAALYSVMETRAYTVCVFATSVEQTR